jgi:hypothetical protein
LRAFLFLCFGRVFGVGVLVLAEGL